MNLLLRLAKRIVRGFLWLPYAAAFFAGSAAAQSLGGGGDAGVPAIRVVAALIFCLLVAVGAAYALRSRPEILQALNVTRNKRRLKLVESLRLSHQIDLCIVSCDGHELLVSASAKGVEVLDHKMIAESGRNPVTGS